MRSEDNKDTSGPFFSRQTPPIHLCLSLTSHGEEDAKDDDFEPDEEHDAS